MRESFIYKYIYKSVYADSKKCKENYKVNESQLNALKLENTLLVKVYMTCVYTYVDKYIAQVWKFKE